MLDKIAILWSEDVEHGANVLGVPGKPELVEVIGESPTSVTLRVTPSPENGGLPVFGYRLVYENTITDFG